MTSRGISVKIQAAVILFCLSLTNIHGQSESSTTIFTVFPSFSEDVTQLVVYPASSRKILTRWGPSVDPYVEKVFQNGIRYYQSGDYENASKLYGFTVQAAADRKADLSRGQLSMILTQRAYALVDAGHSEEALELWNYRISMWGGEQEWKNEVPEGLRISVTDDAELIGLQLADSYGERSICKTVLGDHASALDDVNVAAALFRQFGYPENAIWFYLTFMSNGCSQGAYEAVLEANTLVSEVMAAEPNAVTFDDILSVRRFTALAATNLGDLTTAYWMALANITMAESAGFSGESIQADRVVLKAAEKALAVKVARGDGDLQEAILVGDEQAVGRLLEAGADPNQWYGDQTPLMLLARTSGSVAIADRLISAGADPNSRGTNNLTALGTAAGYTDNRPLVRRLLDAGAEVDVHSPLGWNALMMAVRRGQSPGIVEDLLDAGADPKSTTLDGVTVLELAESRGHPGILLLVRNALNSED